LDYDLIDDAALAVTPPDRYQVVIISANSMIMESSWAWLAR
jgi:hypothetical protein